MREGWEYKKLGDVCTIERGGSPRPIADYITESADGINWIKIGDAVEESKYILFTKEKIRPEGIKKSRFVHKGDVILLYCHTCESEVPLPEPSCPIAWSLSSEGRPERATSS